MLLCSHEQHRQKLEQCKERKNGEFQAWISICIRRGRSIGRRHLGDFEGLARSDEMGCAGRECASPTVRHNAKGGQQRGRAPLYPSLPFRPQQRLSTDFRGNALPRGRRCRSEEHTSELQSLMRISYAVFCLKKKNKKN